MWFKKKLKKARCISCAVFDKGKVKSYGPRVEAGAKAGPQQALHRHAFAERTFLPYLGRDHVRDESWGLKKKHYPSGQFHRL